MQTLLLHYDNFVISIHKPMHLYFQLPPPFFFLKMLRLGILIHGVNSFFYSEDAQIHPKHILIWDQAT